MGPLEIRVNRYYGHVTFIRVYNIIIYDKTDR